MIDDYAAKLATFFRLYSDLVWTCRLNVFSVLVNVSSSFRFACVCMHVCMCVWIWRYSQRSVCVCVLERASE